MSDNYGGYTTGSDANATDSNSVTAAQAAYAQSMPTAYAGGDPVISSSNGPTPEQVQTAIQMANQWTPALSQPDGSYVFPSGQIGTQGPGWQIRDGHVYGDLQAAANALGILPSQANMAGIDGNVLNGAKGMMAAVSPFMAILPGLSNWALDNGLPGYAKTPEERAADEANRSSRTGGYAFGMPQEDLDRLRKLAEEKTTSAKDGFNYGNPYINAVGLFQNPMKYDPLPTDRSVIINSGLWDKYLKG